MSQTHPLRQWREENRTTLTALAAKLGVTPSHLSEIERGLNSPSMDLAGRIRSVTRGAVTPNDLTRERPSKRRVNAA